MHLKRRIMITPEGAYYIIVMSFVFTGAVLREINLMLLLAGMMLGPLVYNWRAAVRMTRQLGLRRRLPDTAIAGQPVTVELALSCRRRISGVRLIDSVERVSGHSPDSRAVAVTMLAQVGPGGRATVRYRLLVAERGEYRFGPVLVRSSFPFGLIRRTVEHDLPGSLLVFPRRGKLAARASAMFPQAHETASERRPSYAAGDFYGLRDYRSGDSRRHIHWRTSARRGKLTVRQFERPLHHDTAIYLDLWQPVRPTEDDRQHVELAVSFAATLVHDLCRRDGCRVWLAVAGSESGPLQGVASAWLAREAMSRLTRAEASSCVSDPRAWSQALAEAPSHALRVLITSRDNAPPNGDLEEYLGQARQSAYRGQVVCIRTHDAAFGEYFQIDASTGPKYEPANSGPVR